MPVAANHMNMDLQPDIPPRIVQHPEQEPGMCDSAKCPGNVIATGIALDEPYSSKRNGL